MTATLLDDEEAPQSSGRQPSRAQDLRAAPSPRQRLPSSTWGAMSAMAGGTRATPPRPQRDDVLVQQHTHHQHLWKPLDCSNFGRFLMTPAMCSMTVDTRCLEPIFRRVCYGSHAACYLLYYIKAVCCIGMYAAQITFESHLGKCMHACTVGASDSMPIHDAHTSLA